MDKMTYYICFSTGIYFLGYTTYLPYNPYSFKGISTLEDYLAKMVNDTDISILNLFPLKTSPDTRHGKRIYQVVWTNGATIDNLKLMLDFDPLTTIGMGKLDTMVKQSAKFDKETVIMNIINLGQAEYK